MRKENAPANEAGDMTSEPSNERHKGDYMTKKSEKQSSGRGGARPGSGSKPGVPRGPYKTQSEAYSHKLNVAITEADYEALAALANEQGVRVSEILRQAITEYIKKTS